MSSVVTFTNVSEQDFTHSWQGVPYTIKARESVSMPEVLARHLAKHLARRILNSKAASEIKADDRFKTAYDNKDEQEMIALVLSDRVHKPAPPELSEAEKMRERVESLNSMNEEMNEEDGIEEVDKSSPVTYADKAEVIAELEKRGISHDKRKSKDKLEQLLVE